jgi:hypothetical protein
MRRTPIVLLIVALLAPGMLALAQRTIPLSLDRMVRQAGVIVHGRVVATETGLDPRTGSPATWTTLEVRENFAGATGATIRYKQYGGEANGYVLKLADMPRLTAGSEVILLLYPPSPKTGFQSPVGMAQGVFHINTTRSGKRVTQSARTPELLKTSRRTPLALDRSGSMDLETFKGTLRTLVREVKP